MKTLIRIKESLEGPQIQAEKFSAFAVKQLADQFSARADVSEDGLMIIEKGLDDRPIYIVMSTRPPELFSSGVEMYGVFWPLESQEPVATFVDEPAATEWAAGQYSEGTFVVRSIDATHNIGIQVSVVIGIWNRQNEVLYARLPTGQWTFPEGRILLGESAHAGAVRAAEGVGLSIEATKIPARVPYTNTYFRQANQHFLTLVLYAGLPDGQTPEPVSDDYAEVGWFPAAEPPSPLFPLMDGIMRIAKSYGTDTLKTASS